MTPLGRLLTAMVLAFAMGLGWAWYADAHAQSDGTGLLPGGKASPELDRGYVAVPTRLNGALYFSGVVVGFDCVGEADAPMCIALIKR